MYEKLDAREESGRIVFSPSCFCHNKLRLDTHVRCVLWPVPEIKVSLGRYEYKRNSKLEPIHHVERQQMLSKIKIPAAQNEQSP